MAKSRWISEDKMSHVLALLTPVNRLICEVLLHTGLRLGDVLLFRKETVKRRFTISEQKTGKRRTVTLTDDLLRRLGAGGEGWCFPNARDPKRHRTRSAVWRDVTRAAKALRYKGVSPHSARKCFAVDYYNKTGGDLEKTRRALNHDRDITTMLYALADKIK